MKGMQVGTVIVVEDGAVSGLVDGDVIVRAPARATVSGIVQGDVIVEPGAFAKVTGIVAGRVEGNAAVTGIVRG